MLTFSLRGLAAIATLWILLGFVSAIELPKGWYPAGSHWKSYEMGLEENSGRQKGAAATIRSMEDSIPGYGSLMQDFLPGKFLGERLRLKGWMKSKDVKEWAGFWVQVNASNDEKPLSFDNMSDRMVKGTTDWTPYEIVVDVPRESQTILMGAILNGTGQIWFDDLSLEVVDRETVSTTGKGNAHFMPHAEPMNLGLE